MGNILFTAGRKVPRSVESNAATAKKLKRSSDIRAPSNEFSAFVGVQERRRQLPSRY